MMAEVLPKAATLMEFVLPVFTTRSLPLLNVGGIAAVLLKDEGLPCAIGPHDAVGDAVGATLGAEVGAEVGTAVGDAIGTTTVVNW